MKKIIVAIDGHAGCGKSTTAKAVASALGFLYIDTGAMYRAATLHLLKAGVDLKNEDQVARALSRLRIGFAYNAGTGRNETLLNGENVEQTIRGMAVSERVSDVAAISAVRRQLVSQQQRIGQEAVTGVVMDGRDIGTVVFPQAELKIFMTADVRIRAERRAEEMGGKVTVAELEANMRQRDHIDSNRADSPLTQASDAVIIDTTHLTIEQQTAKVIELVKGKL